MLVNNGRSLQIPQVEKPSLPILPPSYELIVLIRETDRVNLCFVRYYLLALHRIQIPDAPDSIKLGNGQHVGLIRAPVKTGYWRLVWSQSSTHSLLLNVTKQLCEILIHHPNFYAFAGCCHQIAAYCGLPNNLRGRVLVWELLNFYKTLRCLWLLRLLV